MQATFLRRRAEGESAGGRTRITAIRRKRYNFDLKKLSQQQSREGLSFFPTLTTLPLLFRALAGKGERGTEGKQMTKYIMLSFEQIFWITLVSVLALMGAVELGIFIGQNL